MLTFFKISKYFIDKVVKKYYVKNIIEKIRLLICLELGSRDAAIKIKYYF